MKINPICMLLLAVVLAFPIGEAQAIEIKYQAIDLADTTVGEDLWQYTYTISDYTFSEDTGFTIFFDSGLYTLIDPAPSAPNADWDVLTWDPDPSLPDDGAYDAYALINNASLSDSFTVSFVWLGADTPGAQSYDVYDGITWDILESGTTVASQAAPVPEPATMLLLGVGLTGLTAFRKRIKKA